MKQFLSIALLALVMFSGNVFAQREVTEGTEVAVSMPAPPPCKHDKEIIKCVSEAEKEKKALIIHFLIEHKNYFNDFDLDVLKADLESLSKEELKLFMNTNFVNPNANFAVSLLTSVLGVDRFVIGQTDIGLLKLLTAGGIGIWAIIDWFQIKELTQEYNFNKAEEIIYIIKD